MKNLQEEYNLISDAMTVWGKEIIIDGIGDVEKTNKELVIRDFLKELVKRIDMKAYKDPIVEYFGEGDLLGFTAVQLIYTSNITLHTDKNGKFFLNVFSCKNFEEDVVEKCCEEFFDLKIDYSVTEFRGTKNKA